MKLVNKISVIFSVGVLSLTEMASAQSVGIGTITPDPVSILDVTVPDTTGNPQGLLLPRLWSSNRATLTPSLNASHAGLIVYDLDSNCVTIWKGDAWDGCSKDDGGSNYWSISGNDIGAGDFIGTNNAQDLFFRVNGTQVGHMYQGNGVSFGSAANAGGIASMAFGSAVTASGNRSMALGNHVTADDLGSLVIGDWSGSTPAATSSSTFDQFTARFQNGYRFFTDPSLTANQGIYFAGDGNVGIGNAVPAEKLDVEGNVQIDGDYTYESAKIDYYSLSAADFVPTFNTADRYSDGNGTGNAKWFENGAPGSAGYFYAGIHVPNGAVISNVEFFHRDTDAGGEMSVTLRRFDLAANNLQTLGTGSTGVAFNAGLGSINIPITHTVDNSRYSYYLVVESDQDNTNLWLRGAIVQYSVLRAD